MKRLTTRRGIATTMAAASLAGALLVVLDARPANATVHSITVSTTSLYAKRVPTINGQTVRIDFTLRTDLSTDETWADNSHQLYNRAYVYGGQPEVSQVENWNGPPPAYGTCVAYGSSECVTPGPFFRFHGSGRVDRHNTIWLSSSDSPNLLNQLKTLRFQPWLVGPVPGSFAGLTVSGQSISLTKCVEAALTSSGAKVDCLA